MTGHRIRESNFAALVGMIAVVVAGAAETLASELKIDEAILLRLATEETPSKQSFLIRRHRSDHEIDRHRERYQPELFSQLRYGRSDLVPMVAFAPTFSPTEGYEVGVRKNFAYGLSGSLSTFADQASADGVTNDSTSAGIKGSLTVDLWKNLYGELDRLQLDRLDLQKSRTEIQYQVDQRNFEIQVRQIYWALVTNAESVKVTQEMLNTATDQWNAAKTRLRESVSTAAEVARYKAQVSAREATLTALDYERQNLLMQLKRALPQLEHRLVALAPYDLDRTREQVMTCTNAIESRKDVPWDFTKYDELVSLLEREYQHQSEVTRRHDRADIKFFAEGEYSGREEGYSGGYEEFSSDGKTAFTVGVNLSVPIGEERRRSLASKTRIERAEFLAQKDRLLADAAARHHQMLPMLKMLAAAVHSQKQTGQDLEKAILGSQQLYNQARIRIDTLINDQTALLSNRLDELNTRKLVLSELLNYLQIFTDVPCAFNKSLTAQKG